MNIGGVAVRWESGYEDAKTYLDENPILIKVGIKRPYDRIYV